MLSSTDVEQAWGVTTRERIVEQFDAKLVSDLCCVKKINPNIELSDEIKNSNFQRLIAGMPSQFFETSECVMFVPGIAMSGLCW